MKLVSPSGRVFNISKPQRYLVQWDKPSRSKFQFHAKKFLQRYWKNDVVFEEFPVPHTKLTLDFFNFSTNVAIEVQGIQHRKYSKFFHGNTNYKYLDQLKRDQYKFDFCEEFGIVLVEIYSEEEFTEDFFKKQGIIL